MFENGRTSGWRSMPSASAMNRAARLDPGPGRRMRLREGVAERRVGERDAILDVGREMVRPGRRDDVDLEGHARPELDRRAGEDRRVDPFVEPDLVARVEEDAKERVAEAARDDVVEDAAGLADVERLVPLPDRLEIRPDQPVDVIGDRRRQLPGILDDEPGPAGERAPDPERDGEPVAALDRAVAGAEQAQRRPRPGGQHQMARQRHPVPVEQADRLALGHPRSKTLTAGAGRRSRSDRTPIRARRGRRRR